MNLTVKHSLALSLLCKGSGNEKYPHSYIPDPQLPHWGLLEEAPSILYTAS